MLYLNKEFEQHWQGANPFEELQSIDGKVFREVKNRKTFQFTMAGESYFAKLHFGVGWPEIFKNLTQLRLPILGAENEWQAINKIQTLGIATMQLAAYGSNGSNPATRTSFLVTRDLQNTTSLEEVCANWKENKPAYEVKRALIKEVARIARTLHINGICHRDFYLCHFLLHSSDDSRDEALKLSLIDLHRALIKDNLASRWLVKDVAGLYFSAMDIGLGRRDLFRFIKDYDAGDLHTSLTLRRQFWAAVELRAKLMYKKLRAAD
jgi:heptose I phosphotransferase